jgi:hypothetical protein
MKRLRHLGSPKMRFLAETKKNGGSGNVNDMGVRKGAFISRIYIGPISVVFLKKNTIDGLTALFFPKIHFQYLVLNVIISVVFLLAH